MTAIAIRKKIIDMVQGADSKKLKAIYKFLEEDIEDEGRISLEQYNAEVDEAMRQVKKGEVYSHEAVKKMTKDW
ncbi:MAG: hypothetical protein K2X48_07835 [Chitinophagaceae bacterium]|nr:hypothetical protein [Chitinophagaceae bacterium]